MNRTLLIALLAVLVIAGVVVSLSVSRGSQRRTFLSQTVQIGIELIRTTNSPRLVVVGAGFRERLSQLLASPTVVEKVMPGDEPPPLGDGKAASRLILKNQKGERLGIRFRKSKDGDKVDVLGYWTPETFMEFHSPPAEKVPLH